MLNLANVVLLKHNMNTWAHTIYDQGVVFDPSKVTFMLSWPTPLNINELRGFQGIIESSSRIMGFWPNF